MIDYRKAQGLLRVAQDGDFGRLSFAALLEWTSGHKVPDKLALGSALAQHFEAYELDTPNRLSAFLGQCCHESKRFTDYREDWGPTRAQLGYEGRADLGNVKPGDGRKYCGRALIEITGRANYRAVGLALDIPLEINPEIAEEPYYAVLVSMEWWKQHGMNVIADKGDDTLTTKHVNGGTNGLSERIAYTNAARRILV